MNYSIRVTSKQLDKIIEGLSRIGEHGLVDLIHTQRVQKDNKHIARKGVVWDKKEMK
jgi:hypothetical protein